MEVFVSRQAIVDPARQPHACESLYRPNAEDGGAAQQGISGAILSTGLLTRRATAATFSKRRPVCPYTCRSTEEYVRFTLAADLTHTAETTSEREDVRRPESNARWEAIREFLLESHENLSRLDQELVELEKHPNDGTLLGSVFRTIHTIKGTCGFLSFSILERITHQAETLLSQLRDGKWELSPALTSFILETVDATRKLLTSVEASGEEGPDIFGNLTERLRAAAQESQRNPRLPPENTKPEEDAAKYPSVTDANILVGVGLLDRLMDLVGELALIRNQILQFSAEREDAALSATSQRLNLITTKLQEGVMKTRMQPIGMVWNKLPRIVRDISVSPGKQIRLEMDGAETELDRTIIEAIKDPLVHLVRNSCDHGIEPPEVRVRAGKSPEGRLTLRAYQVGGQVNIEIGDDGAGIDAVLIKRNAIDKGLLRREEVEKLSDRETLKLIFLPGFSTAETVTNVSGRGVGMDVVKSHIEKIGGIVDVSSRLGEGATVKIKIPHHAGHYSGLVIARSGDRFVIPGQSVRIDPSGGRFSAW